MASITAGTVRVFTFRDGVLSRLGHDLQLHVDRFEIEVEGDDVKASLWSDSLVLDGAVRNGALDTSQLSARDQRDILDNAAKVLQTRRHPQVRYVGTVRQTTDRAHEIDGQLELVGRTQSVPLTLARDGGRLRCRLTLTAQPLGHRALQGAARCAAAAGSGGGRVGSARPGLGGVVARLGEFSRATT